MLVNDGSMSNPLAPTSFEYVLLSTFVLGVMCTFIAVRRSSKGEMRPSAAVTVLLLNFLPVVGPIAAALGIAVHYQRHIDSQRVA